MAGDQPARIPERQEFYDRIGPANLAPLWESLHSLVTAAPHAVPPALFDQLKLGGRLIAPVGPDGRQELIRYTKTETRIEQKSLGMVSFVPLLSGLQR